MKFSCEKEILLGLLGTASRAVTGKSSMPLLEGLLICADASTLTVTGYDMSMGIRTTTETDVVEPGSIVINDIYKGCCRVYSRQQSPDQEFPFYYWKFACIMCPRETDRENLSDKRKGFRSSNRGCGACG